MIEDKPRGSIGKDAAMVLRGMAMGAADVVPGVSGGTVALVCGIYRRLVTAVSHFDLALLGLVRQRQWKAAADRIDLRFILFLGLGIGLGIVAFARTMKFLLDHRPEPTLAVFFGLIAASSFIVVRMVRYWTLGAVLLAAAAAAFAFWLTGLVPTEAPVTYPYLFLCGVVAISAMILPGISGSFILLILGMYGHVIGVVSDVTTGAITAENLLFLAIFGSGCALGLIGFTKVLKLLLVRFESATMALMCGVMIGSLRRVWPFQDDGVNFLPPAEDWWLPAMLALSAMAAVLVFDAVARRIGAAQAKRDPDARDAGRQSPGQQSSAQQSSAGQSSTQQSSTQQSSTQGEEDRSHMPPRETLSL